MAAVDLRPAVLAVTQRAVVCGDLEAPDTALAASCKREKPTPGGGTRAGKPREKLAMRLLALPRGSLFPQLLGAQGGGGAGKSGKSDKPSTQVPAPNAAAAAFSRFQKADVAWVRALHAEEQAKLLQQHRDCLRASCDAMVGRDVHTGNLINADIEYLPAVELALELLQSRQRAFEQQLKEAAAKAETLPMKVDAASVAAAAASACTAPVLVAPHLLLQLSAAQLGAETSASEVKSGQGAAAAAFPSLPVRQRAGGNVAASTVPEVSATAPVREAEPVLAREVSSPSTEVTVQPDDPARVLFYQAGGGQAVFLHPLCMRAMLSVKTQGLGNANAVNSFAPDEKMGATPPTPPSPPVCRLPTSLVVDVLEVETMRVTPALRSRFTFLRHLPLGMDAVRLVEIDLRPLVPKAALAPFQEEIAKRKQRRWKQKQVQAREAEADMARELGECVLCALVCICVVYAFSS